MLERGFAGAAGVCIVGTDAERVGCVRAGVVVAGLFKATLGEVGDDRVHVVVVFARLRSNVVAGTGRDAAPADVVGVDSRRPKVISLLLPPLAWGVSRLAAGVSVRAAADAVADGTVLGEAVANRLPVGSVTRVGNGLVATASRDSPRVVFPAGTVDLPGDPPSGLRPVVTAGLGVRPLRGSIVARRSLNEAVETLPDSSRFGLCRVAAVAGEVGGRFGRRITSSLPPRSKRSPGTRLGPRPAMPSSRTRTGRSSRFVYCPTRSTPMPLLMIVLLLPTMTLFTTVAFW